MATQLLRDLCRLAEDRWSVVRWYLHKTRFASYWRNYRFALPLPRIRPETRNMMLVLIAVICLLPLIVWASILQSIPPTQVEPVNRVPQSQSNNGTFQQRWASASSEPLPNSIRTILIRPEQPTPSPERASAHAELPTVEESPSTVASKPYRVKKHKRIHVRATALDICARHGMHKQYYQRGNWKGWRCRK